MFRRERIGRRGKESVQAYKIKLEREADCDEAYWFQIVTENSILTIGLVYRSPNLNEEDKKMQNTIKEVTEGEYIIMCDFSHGHTQWKSLESTVSILNTGQLPFSACARTNQGRECIIYSFVFTK